MAEKLTAELIDNEAENSSDLVKVWLRKVVCFFGVIKRIDDLTVVRELRYDLQAE